MNALFAIGMPSMQELIIIFLVILLLFGAKKLPELAKGMGQAIREFKKASKEATDSIQSSIEEETKTPPPPAQAPQDSEKKDH